MDEVPLTGAMAGLDPDAAARARELIAALVEEDQVIARAEGRKATILADLAAIADDEGAGVPGSNGPEYARRAMAADVAAATRIHPSAAKNRMEDASILVSDFPTTHAALSEGRISKRHADLIVGGTATGWERLFTKPDTGEIVAVGRYRPSEQQRRALIGRDMTCRFPGCTTPARKADIDHTHDYALGGDTDIGNLAHLCEPHHVMKHHSGWRVRQLAGGDMEWTSPTGGVYVNEPISRVFFREDPDIAEDRDRLRREQADRERFERERRERTRDDAERRRAAYERAAEAARQQRYRDEAEPYAADADEFAATWSVEDEQALVTAILNGELTPPEGRPTELAPA